MSKLLIVVDYQKDFVDGTLGFPAAVALEGPITDKIAAYRRTGDSVAFTLDTHDDAYLDTQEGRHLPIRHTIRDTPGWALFGRVAEAREEGDPCFIKSTYGCDDLFDYLRAHPFEQIELVGVVSSICVISNAILAQVAQPETPIVVDAACVAGADEKLHKAALDIMEGLQIAVINR